MRFGPFNLLLIGEKPLIGLLGQLRTYEPPIEN